MSRNLEGKVALVTGASRGIGRATALKLAKDGATVLVHYGQNAGAAQEVVSAIRSDGGKAWAVGADLSDSTGVNKLATEVISTLETNGLGKTLDILVNNAAIATFSGLDDTTEEAFDRLFQINVKSVFFLTQKLSTLIPEGGRIINVSSAVSRTSFPNVLPYAATKGAIDVLTKHLAAALGARGITVNAVAPGAIETDMSGWLRSEEGANMARSIQALQQVGQPQDIASAIAFLAGPDGKWVTGQVLDASGGTKL